MNRIILFLFCFLSLNLKAQICSRTVAMFQMAPGGYIINGTATLSEFTGGILEISFDGNFSTTVGPDLHVFLSKTFAPGNASNLNKLLIAPLTSNSGAQLYTVPQGISINDFDYVIIHCVALNHFWGGGLLGTPIGSCQTAGIEKIVKNKGIVIYPNPAKESILVKTDAPADRITIYNIYGRKIIEAKPLFSHRETQLDLHFLDRGLYILKMESNEGSAVQQLLIQ